MIMLLKNNLIAIFIHICICFILLLPFIVIYNGTTGKFVFLTSGVFTIIAFFLYYWSGMKFLSNTHSILANIFSVILLFVIVLVALLVAYDTQWERIIRLPFTLFGWIVSHFIGIESNSHKEKYVFMVMLIFPSLAMWLGLITKRTP